MQRRETAILSFAGALAGFGASRVMPEIPLWLGWLLLVVGLGVPIYVYRREIAGVARRGVYVRTSGYLPFTEAGGVLLEHLGDEYAPVWRDTPYSMDQWGLIQLEEGASQGLVQLYEAYGKRALVRITFDEAEARPDKPHIGFQPTIYVRHSDIEAAAHALRHDFQETGK